MKTFRLLVITAVALFMLIGTASSGTFNDRDGGAHAWTVDGAHALVWEGSTYMPFGVVFQPRYFAEQTDNNWSADEQDVTAYKLTGVTDVIVKPGKGISSIPVEAFQRIIDLLETNGLRYGIELDDSPYIPLTGYVVQPTVNRVENIKASGAISRTFVNTKTALYVLCEASTGDIRDSGQSAANTNGEVAVKVALRTDGSHVLLFYPLKTMGVENGESGSADVWSDHDRHRDRLISYLPQIKFGKGLRFFIDPFTENFGFRGEAESLIPTSDAFRFEYMAWLSKKYNTTSELSLAWNVLKHDVSSFGEAARLVPLWRNGRGVSAAYDDEIKKQYPVDAASSKVWADFQEFRASSIRAYMDGMADVLKRTAADVPVVFTATDLQPVFQSGSLHGFDGLAVSAVGGSDIAKSAGQVLSLAENSSKESWLISRLRPANAVFEKKEDLCSSMNALHDLGVKGFFITDAQGSGIQGADLLTWLAEYASLSGQDKQYAAYRPQAIYYPVGAMQMSPKRLQSGIWWLPTLIGGGDMRLGNSFGGYTKVDPKGAVDICIWSLKGKQMMQLVTPNPVTVTSASGDAVEVQPKKGRVAFTVSDEPVTISGIPVDQFLPVECVSEAIQEFEKAVARAEQQRLDVDSYKQQAKRAKELLNNNQPMGALDTIQVFIGELNLRLQGLENQPAVAPNTPNKT